MVDRVDDRAAVFRSGPDIARSDPTADTGAFKNGAVSGGILCAVVFAVLCWMLFRNAQKNLDS